MNQATLSEEIQALQNQLTHTHDALTNATHQLDAQESELERARIELAKTFLIVGIDWEVRDADVDLHITDPLGNEFSYSSNNRTGHDFPNTDAQLSYDMLTGPGIELWQVPTAESGNYKIEYKLFAAQRNPIVAVKGDIYDRQGRHSLPLVHLRRIGERVVVATVTVNEDGHVALTP